MAEEKENSLRDEIYARMSERDTEDLIEIYEENDLEGRTEESLEIVRQILVERLGELPEQDDDEDEDKLPSPYEEAFGFPQDKTLYRLADGASRLAGVFLTVAVINALLKLGNYFTNTLPPAFWQTGRIYEIILPIFGQLEGVLYAGFLYFLLHAITEIIYLLMDIRELFLTTEANGASSESSL